MVKPRRKKGAVLQERDTLLLDLLATQFRLLSRDQIGELLPMGSVSRLNFRLKRLVEGRYLSTRLITTRGPSHKLTYYLGPRSLDTFADSEHQEIAASAREQAAELTALGLPHRMLVDDIHIRFLVSQRLYPHFKLITWVDQYSQSWEQLRKLGLFFEPDGYGEYRLSFAFQNVVPFFVEADRGTERGTLLLEKIDRYLRYAALLLTSARLSAEPFRVLFITESNRRTKNLLEVIGTKTDKLFWVTTADRFRQAQLFDPHWSRPHQEGRHSLAPGQ